MLRFRLFSLWPLALSLVVWSICPDASAREKRTRYLELQPMVGYSWVNVTGFSDDKFEDAVRASATDPSNLNADPNTVADEAFAAGQERVEGHGLSVGGALQLKLWVFVLGARYSYTMTEGFGMHTIGGDLGLRLGDTVALYGRLGPGFAFQDGLPDGLSTDGFVVSGSGGLEFRLAQGFSLGVGVDADLLLLAATRQLEAGAQAATGGVSVSNLRELDGSAVGFQLRPQLHFIWHI